MNVSYVFKGFVNVKWSKTLTVLHSLFNVWQEYADLYWFCQCDNLQAFTIQILTDMSSEVLPKSGVVKGINLQLRYELTCHQKS